MRKSLSIGIAVGVFLSIGVTDGRRAAAQVPRSVTTVPQEPADAVKGRVTGHLADRTYVVSKATVTLRAVDARAAAYETTSNDKGVFTIDDVDPGRYVLVAERSGFVTQVYGAKRPAAPGTVLTVTSGQTVEVKIELVATGAIGGRVSNAEGEPQSGLPVLPFRYQYVGGVPRLVPAGLIPAVTDDRGEFRIPNLAPGRYVLGTTPQRLGGAQPAAAAIGKQTEEAAIQTYYPGTADPATALPVEVFAGSEVLGIDWALVVEPVFHVTGTLVTGRGGIPASGTLILYRRFSSGISALPTSMVTARGPFEMRRVPAGSYALAAMSDNLQNRAIVSIPIDVGAHVDGLVVPFGGGADVRVVARLERPPSSTSTAAARSAAARALQGIRVALRPLENPYAPVASVQLDDSQDGTFRGVLPGRYTVAITGLSEGTFVKSAIFGDHDALQSSGIEIADAAGQELVVLIGAPAAVVSGRVTDARGTPVAGAIVTAVPTAAGRLDMIATSATDQHGVFEIRRLVPAEYRIFAWEDIDIGAVANEEFMGPFRARGSLVTAPSGRVDGIALKIVPRDEINNSP